MGMKRGLQRSFLNLLAGLVKCESCGGLLKPQHFVQTKKEERSILLSLKQNAKTAGSLDLVWEWQGEEYVLSLAHMFLSNRGYEGSVGRWEERKHGQCRADKGDVGGHLIDYHTGRVSRCTTKIQRK